MAVSVRLDPVIEAKLTQQANLLGITKSDFIKDAIERVLGIKDPAVLLREVRSGSKLGRRDASANVSKLMKAKLRALSKHRCASNCSNGSSAAAFRCFRSMPRTSR